MVNNKTQNNLIILAVGLALAVLPIDPTDVFDAGTPIIELIGTTIALYLNNQGGKK